MSNEFCYEMLNQSLKGIISGLGSGSGPTKNAIVVKLSKEIEPGEKLISKDLIEACSRCQEGAYLIVASKVISISQRRIIVVPKYPLPNRHAPYEMLNLLKRYNRDNMKITLRDAIGADLIFETNTELSFSLLPDNPNREAAEMAKRLYECTGKLIDVIISDTSSGWYKGKELIGIPTLLATPIGSTKGCDIYYAQRLSAMAEVLRNKEALAPFIIVEPPTIRSRSRSHCGEAREEGFLIGNDQEVYIKND